MSSNASPSEEAFLRDVAATSSAPHEELEAGTKVARYTIERVLGHGGMGVVYAAMDIELERRVALKVLPAALVSNPERRKRFLREARLAAAATHPNVTVVHDAGEDGGHVFIAMELLSGRTLRQRLAEGGPLAIEEAHRIAKSIAAALATAHARDIVHRDLKPENVMLTPDGTKVLDFGIAKLREPPENEPTSASTATATNDGHILGTPGYMSPEQARGERVDDRTDVFAFGVTLYEALAGKRPFEGKSTVDVLAAITRDDPVSPVEHRAEIPDELASLVLDCLHKESSKRPSANDIAERLERLAPTPKRFRIGWSYVALGASALAVVAAVVGAFATRPHDDPAPPAAAPSPLAAPASVLACPILESSGTREPNWLGAAAADAACRRAAWLLGGAIERTRVPGDLLDLPHRPVADLPSDPYADASSREKTLAAAKTRGAAWLDGRVALERGRFAIDLRLERTGAGSVGVIVVATGHGEGNTLDAAVAAALGAMEGVDRLPRASAITPEVARWTGVSSVETSLLFDLFDDRDFQGTEKCDVLRRNREALGRAYAMTECDALPLEQKMDATSLETAALTARFAHAGTTGTIPEDLRKAHASATNPYARSHLARAEASLALAESHASDAEAWVLTSLDDNPRSFASWLVLTEAIEQARGDLGLVFRGARAWAPALPSAWSPPFTTLEDIRFAWRGFELAQQSSPHASRLAFRLAKDAKWDDLRALASMLATGGKEVAPAHAFTLAAIAIGDVRFGEALQRYEEVGKTGDTYLFRRASLASIFLAEAIGRETEVADSWASKFVNEKLDPRMDPGNAAFVCARASKPVAAACIDRMTREAKSPGESLLLRAARLTSEGKMREAADAWRPFLHTETARIGIPPHVYDRIGEIDIAASIDADLDRWPCGAVGCGHARMATRAKKRGDMEKAKALAADVIASWGQADTRVPALDDMRAILVIVAPGK